MHRAIHLAMLGTFPLMLMSSGAFAQSAAPAVSALTERFVAAWNAHDPAAMAATYTADGSLTDPFQSSHGRDAVRAAFAGLQAGPAAKSTTAFNVKSIEPLGDGFALADAIQTVTGMSGPDGKPLPPQTFAVTMVVHQESGGWAYRAVRVGFAGPPGP